MQVTLLFTMIGLAFNAATSHIYPVRVNKSKLVELKDAYAATIRWAMLLAVPAFLGFALNGYDIVGLMDPEFIVRATALFILAGGALLKRCLGNSGFLIEPRK